MNCDLRGLVLNAASQIRRPDKGSSGYYAASLEELAGHIADVRAGRATLQAFADCYGLNKEEAPNGN